MATLAPTPPRTLGFALQARQAVPLVLLLAAVALRLPHLGDPAFMIDEQFYLVAGTKLLHGALPYVDVWDRKPIGLFLLYAIPAACGAWGILAYQMLAMGFAAATAIVIARIVRPMAGTGGGLIAGLLYLVWIDMLEGGGGQSPVFYNLAMAGAGWAVLAAGDATDPRRHRRLGFAAMALGGIAIQIKYCALFETMAFGLMLSWWALRRLPNLGAAVARTGLLAATALAPTGIAFAFYAAIGQARTFWFANFTSIFLRGPTPGGMLINRAESMLLLLSPFAICIAASLWLLHDRRDAVAVRWRVVTIGWCAAAMIGLVSVGTLYMHYLLPTMVPFTIAAAPIFRRRGTGPMLALLSAIVPVVSLHYPDFDRTEKHRRQIAALTALIPRDVTRGCMQMYAGPTILYWTTHACTVTRYIFPDHLSAANEAPAIGTDTVAELRRVLARRPRVITIGAPDPNMGNRRTYALLRTVLPRDYRHAGTAPLDDHDVEVWVRRT